MLENYIAVIFKTFVFVLGLLALLTMTLIGVQVLDGNYFKEYANDAISRGGGATDEVIEQIHLYSTQTYNGRFSIQVVQNKGSQPYGATVVYKLQNIVHPILFLDRDITLKNYSSVVIQKR